MKQVVLLLFALLCCSTVTFAQYDNIVINEVSGDSGQSDARNDAIVELAGCPGDDIGCMVVTNGEWAVVVPTGEVIPADGTYLIACSFNASENSSSLSSGSGLTCGECDFAGLVPDFDVCDPSNAANISSSVASYGFTLDNGFCGGNADGDQIVLFQPDGTPQDGVFWGFSAMTPGGILANGGASGSCGAPADHISVQDGAFYLLGDNDEDGNVNNLIVTHAGRKADGTAAIGVREMPVGGACGAVNGVKYYMPGIAAAPVTSDVPESLDGNWVQDDTATDPDVDNTNVLAGFWTYLGTSFSSCNSSYARIAGSNGRHGMGSSSDPSHQDDADLDADWALPYDCAGTNPSPSRLGGGDGTTLAQWGYTDHPTPGTANADDTWDFYVFEGTFNAANLTPANEIGTPASPRMHTIMDELGINCFPTMVTFALQVYNYQQVEALAMTINKAGSFVTDETGVVQSWVLHQTGHSTAASGPGAVTSADDGVTTMYYTADLSALAGGKYTFTLFWDDYTDCCGSGAQSTVQNRAGASSQHECYEDMTVMFTIIDPMMYDCNGDNVADNPNMPCAEIDCADMDPMAGAININEYFVNGSGDYIFTFTDNDNPANNTQNTTGVFQLPTDGGTGGYTVTVEDNGGALCNPPQLTFTINDNCELPPMCPENFNITIDGGAGPVDACPGDMVEICFSADELTPGGSIMIEVDTDGDDVFETTLCTEPVPTTVCPTAAGVYISEVNSVASSGTDQCSLTGESVTLCYQACPCDGPIDISGWELEDSVSDDGNPETSINIISGTLEPGECVELLSRFLADPNRPGAINGDMGSAIMYGADRNECPIWNNGGDDIFLYDGDSQGAGTLIDSETYNSTGLTTFTVPTLDCGGAGGTPQVCCNFTIPSDACPVGAFDFRAVVAPFDAVNCPVGAPDENDAISEEVTANVSCPTADLIPNDLVACTPVDPATVLFMIDLAGGTGPYDIELDTDGDGIADVTITGLTGPTANITYGDVSGALGTAFDVTFTILSITDTGVGGCPGSFDNDEANVMVSDAPEASLTAATDITGCDPKTGGEVTITFEAGTGPFIFEYMDAAGNVIEATAGSGTCPSAGGGGITTVLNEDFTGAVAYTTTDSDNIASTSDYFGVTDGGNINQTFTSVDGDFYAAQDTDGAGDANNSICLTFDDLSIANLMNLMLSVDVAEGDDGTNQDWDADASFTVAIDIDNSGVFTTIFEVTASGTNTEPMATTGGPGAITDDFATFSNAVAGMGGVIDIKVTIMNLGAGDEDIAFDNIILTGEMINTSTSNCTATFNVCEPGDITLLSVTNDAGCPGTINDAVQTVNSAISPTISVVETPGCNDMSGSVDITIAGDGTPDYMITYPGGTATVNANGTTTITGVQSGGTFTLVDANGCETEQIFNFTNPDCPVPVELLTFTGEAMGQNVRLNWTTATELNNDYFQVERSFDAKTFEPIGTVKGAGTTTTTQTYDFIDYAPKTGVNYYRLQQVDFDGSYEYTETVAVKLNEKALTSEVYPNPTNGRLNIFTSEAIFQAQILDLTGRVLQTRNFDYVTTAQLNLADLPAGTYFIELASDLDLEVIQFVKK